MTEMKCPHCTSDLSPKFLDELTDPDADLRPFTVIYVYSDDPETVHSFFSEAGARKSAQEFVDDEFGDSCRILGPDGFETVTIMAETEAPR